jgi:hypothetical protein
MDNYGYYDKPGVKRRSETAIYFEKLTIVLAPRL